MSTFWRDVKLYFSSTESNTENHQKLLLGDKSPAVIR